ncbi:MAG TPA: glycosyltransferase [Desulfatiglandales bacterium]|nr:glycosyltransferase [Desulfatiglandales bacterium]
MALFFIFAGLVTLGIANIVLQNLAIRSSIPKNGVLPESDFLTKEKRTMIGRSKAYPQPSLTMFCPPISIMKPLKGVDDDLFANLTSFCNQAYPEYEIIFGLEEKNDPALKLAQKIKKLYPHQTISIVVKQTDYALNPKVNNLISAYGLSQFPYILISDSDVRVDKDYLMEIIKHMQDPHVGLVSNLIRGIGSRSIGSLLENLHLNSFVIGNVAILTRFFKMPVVVGKSMLMRKKDFEEIGGFEAVKNVLAEDYVIGDLMHKKGKRVITSGHVVNAVNHYRTMKQFIKRHARWGKLRWKLGGAGYVSEIMLNAVFISCLSLVLLGLTTRTISLAATVWLLKIIGDYLLGKRIRSAHHFFHYLLSPIKDIIIGFIWFVPFVSRTVMWRRHRYKITKGSLLVPLHPLLNEKAQ